MVQIGPAHVVHEMREPIAHRLGHGQAQPQPAAFMQKVVEILQLEFRQPPPA